MNPVWVSLVFKDNEILIAYMAKDKDEAVRETEIKFKGISNIIFDLTEKRAADRISNWLAENDILGADNLNIVRDLGDQFATMIESTQLVRL